VRRSLCFENIGCLGSNEFRLDHDRTPDPASPGMAARGRGAGARPPGGFFMEAALTRNGRFVDRWQQGPRTWCVGSPPVSARSPHPSQASRRTRDDGSSNARAAQPSRSATRYCGDQYYVGITNSFESPRVFPASLNWWNMLVLIDTGSHTTTFAHC